MSETKRAWSTLPHKSYSVNYEGKQYGIGTRDIWDQIPGAWNILQLIWSLEAEQLLSWTGDPKEFTQDCGFVPYAVAFALQRYSPSQTWGELAAEVTPSAFLAELKEHPQCDKTILVETIGSAFWARAEVLKLSYIKFSSNVVQGDFGGAGRIH